MIKTLKYITLSLLVISNSSFAVTTDTTSPAIKTTAECEEKYSDVRELSKCLDIVKTHRESVMQTWVNNQTFILEELIELTGRKSPLRIFKRSQKDFVNYRENNCRWQYLANLPGLEAATIYKSCFILLTNGRIEELSLIKND